jgi:hypothetical protein
VGPQLGMMVLGGGGSGGWAQPIPDGCEVSVGLSQRGIGRTVLTVESAGTLPQPAAQAPEDMQPSPLQLPFLQWSHLSHLGAAVAATIAM